MASRAAIMEKNGIPVNDIRLVDHDVAFGVYPDMREHGFKVDAWPETSGRPSTPPTSW